MKKFFIFLTYFLLIFTNISYADEILELENLENDYKLIRIVSHYIHNEEQLSFDRFKLKKILTNLKKKTFSFTMPVISIYTSLGDDVKLPSEDNNILSLLITKPSEIKNDNLLGIFPDIVEKTKHEEKGIDLFVKISEDINKESFTKSKKVEKIFAKKNPYITYAFMLICFVLFILTYIFSMNGDFNNTLVYFGANLANYNNVSDSYRLASSIFLHASLVHLICNMYSLYVIGPQVESFYGKVKYFFIFMLSGISGSLLSSAFMADNMISVGASGAIFGLLGSILYFGYHYRVYLGNTLKSQIIPIIGLNLIIGLFFTGIDIFAHIGGLIGGIFISMLVGVEAHLSHGLLAHLAMRRVEQPYVDSRL